MNSKSRSAMWDRISYMDSVKNDVKLLVLSGLSVVKIKSALKIAGIKPSAYDYFRDRLYVSKWKCELK